MFCLVFILFDVCKFFFSVGNKVVSILFLVFLISLLRVLLVMILCFMLELFNC